MTSFFDRDRGCLPAWTGGEGAAADIVVSTRARLARNLRSFPFPHHASEVELGTVMGDVMRRLRRVNDLAGGEFLILDETDARQRQLLVEARLLGLESAQKPHFRGLVLAPEASNSVLVNDEDHLRLAVVRSGFEPAEAVAAALALDSAVEKEIEAAFDGELGYLTASPAGVGTGLRLSAHLHLPGLVLAGEIEKVLNALRQLQFVVQGLLGKGRTVRGALFQVSNLVTLGLDEEEIAQDFSFHVGRVLVHEKAAREQLYSRDPRGIEDMVWRSLAVLREARLITAQEACDRLSNVRMGVGLGILPDLGLDRLNEALVNSESAHLEFAAGRELAERERTIARADFLRGLFAAPA